MANKWRIRSYMSLRRVWVATSPYGYTKYTGTWQGAIDFVNKQIKRYNKKWVIRRNANHYWVVVTPLGYALYLSYARWDLALAYVNSRIKYYNEH